MRSFFSRFIYLAVMVCVFLLFTGTPVGGFLSSPWYWIACAALIAAGWYAFWRLYKADKAKRVLKAVLIALLMAASAPALAAQPDKLECRDGKPVVPGYIWNSDYSDYYTCGADDKPQPTARCKPTGYDADGTPTSGVACESYDLAYNTSCTPVASKNCAIKDGKWEITDASEEEAKKAEEKEEAQKDIEGYYCGADNKAYTNDKDGNRVSVGDPMLNTCCNPDLDPKVKETDTYKQLCAKDEDGKLVNAEKPEVGLKPAEQVSCDACLNVSQDAETAGWAAQIFMVLFSAGDKMATLTFASLSDTCLQLLAGGALIFIAWTVLQLLIPFWKPVGGDYLETLSKGLFRIFVAAALLAYGAEAFNITIRPIFQLTTELSRSVVSGGTGLPAVAATSDVAQGSLMGPEAMTDLASIVNAIHTEVKRGMAIASTAMCLGWYHPQHTGSILGWIQWFLEVPDFSLVMTGMFLYLGFIILLVMFPLAMIDALVKILFIVAFFPVFILLWAFKLTANYTKTAFDIIINSCLVLFISAVMIKVIMAMYAAALGGGDAASNEHFEKLFSTCEAFAASADVSETDYYKFRDLFIGDSSAWVATLYLFIVMYMGFKALGLVEPLADKLNKNALGNGGNGGDVGFGREKPRDDERVMDQSLSLGEMAGMVALTGAAARAGEGAVDLVGYFAPSVRRWETKKRAASEDGRLFRGMAFNWNKIYHPSRMVNGELDENPDASFASLPMLALFQAVNLTQNTLPKLWQSAQPRICGARAKAAIRYREKLTANALLIRTTYNKLVAADPSLAGKLKTADVLDYLNLPHGSDYKAFLDGIKARESKLHAKYQDLLAADPALGGRLTKEDARMYMALPAGSDLDAFLDGVKARPDSLVRAEYDRMVLSDPAIKANLTPEDVQKWLKLPYGQRRSDFLAEVKARTY